MSLDHVVGRHLVYDEELTLFRTGLIRRAGPSMNCWSISQVLLSSVNLKHPQWKNSSLGLQPLRSVFPDVRGLTVWGKRRHSLMEKRSNDGAALSVSFVHQGVQIRQQGVPGLQYSP